jgi:hypothetical protein
VDGGGHNLREGKGKCWANTAANPTYIPIQSRPAHSSNYSISNTMLFLLDNGAHSFTQDRPRPRPQVFPSALESGTLPQTYSQRAPKHRRPLTGQQAVLLRSRDLQYRLPCEKVQCGQIHNPPPASSPLSRAMSLAGTHKRRYRMMKYRGFLFHDRSGHPHGTSFLMAIGANSRIK